nr:hypothetical protein Iba_chr12eCG6320 [Ipomoea batatas]
MTERKPPMPTGLADATRHQYTKTLRCRSRGRRVSGRSSHAVVAKLAEPATTPELPLLRRRSRLEEPNHLRITLCHQCIAVAAENVTVAARGRGGGHWLMTEEGTLLGFTASASLRRNGEGNAEVVEEAAATVSLPCRRLSSASLLEAKAAVSSVITIMHRRELHCRHCPTFVSIDEAGSHHHCRYLSQTGNGEKELPGGNTPSGSTVGVEATTLLVLFLEKEKLSLVRYEDFLVVLVEFEAFNFNKLEVEFSFLN